MDGSFIARFAWDLLEFSTPYIMWTGFAGAILARWLLRRSRGNSFWPLRRICSVVIAWPLVLELLAIGEGQRVFSEENYLILARFVNRMGMAAIGWLLVCVVMVHAGMNKARDGEPSGQAEGVCPPSD